MTALEDIREIIEEDTAELEKISELLKKMWECKKTMSEVHSCVLEEAPCTYVHNARETMDDWYATWGDMFKMLNARKVVLEDRLIRAGKLEEILSQNKTKVKK